MTKELAREVSGFYLSSPCEVWWILSRSRADGTMSSWLLYCRNFTNFHTVSYIIWTPLWTKCASAAAILSNISADDDQEIFRDDSFIQNNSWFAVISENVRISYVHKTHAVKFSMLRSLFRWLHGKKLRSVMMKILKVLQFDAKSSIKQNFLNT